MPPRRRIKPEPSTIIGDYPTPGASIRSATTVTPKREFLEISDDDDNTPLLSSFKTQSTEDEGYVSRAAEVRRHPFAPRPAAQSPIAPSPPQMAAVTSQMAPVAAQGLEFVGSKVKILVDGISDLRKYGLQHVVGLPELVLVGDQSAGKSSLMSALTEVKLPRDQGICTKCPANIKTSPADKWSCRISLQQEYRYSHAGRSITEATVTKSNPFPPWVEQPLEEKEFLTTENKDDLEDGIKWAQLALLNHDTDYRDFVPHTGVRARGSFESERANAEAKFSPNLISVEISGPGLPALSFYDLPGVFRSAPDRRDQYLVKVIENLAVKYIKRPNALIIWTLAMKTDPSNSETGNIITKCNALQRCIGVLTNPDHVSARHTEYEKVMQGMSHTVEHGYFVTRQPGENSILDGPNYHALARAEEEHFFNTDPLWCGDWRQFRSRCGTTVIQGYLSQQLAKQITASIPKLEGQIEQRKRLIEQELRDCPPLPAFDVRNKVLSLLGDFSSDVKTIMNGESIDIETSFQSDWSTLADQFRDLILHIKPTVIVSHVSDNIPQQDIVEISDDDDEGSYTPSNRKRPAPDGHSFQTPRKNARISESSTPGPHTPAGHASPSGALKQEGYMLPPPTPPRFGRSRVAADNRFMNTPFAAHADAGKGFTNLDKIRSVIAKHARPGMPGLVNAKTYNEICLQAVGSWEAPLQVFMQELFSKVKSELNSILHKHLGRYEQTLLYRTATTQLDNFISTHIAEQRLATNLFYEMETHKSFTINNACMISHQEREYQNLKATRRASRAKKLVLHENHIDPRKRFSADMPPEERNRLLQKRIKEVPDEKIGPDSFDLELRVAAYVRAYYLTAGIRFVDNVCLSIHSKLFRDIRNSISRYLEQKLDIDNAKDGEEVCRTLMEEKSEIAQKRADLLSEMDKLNGFSQRLANLVKQINTPDELPAPASFPSVSFPTSSAALNGDLGLNAHRRDSQSSDTAMGEEGDAAANDEEMHDIYGDEYRPPHVEDADDDEYEYDGGHGNRTIKVQEKKQTRNFSRGRRAGGNGSGLAARRGEDTIAVISNPDI